MTDNLNSIILAVANNHGTIKDLRSFLQKAGERTFIDKREIIVDRSTFAPVLQCSKTIKEAVIYETLLHFVQNPGEQSLEDVIEHLERAIRGRIYAKNNPIRNLNEEFRTHTNYSNEIGTLLHQAVISNNTKAIEALLKHGANPLIKNKEGKISLDLAQGKTREVLIKCMKDQAQSKKEGARCNSLIGIIPSVFFGIGLGVGSALIPSMTIILCALAVSALVAGIAVGMAIYLLSQDHKQAKSIEEAVNPGSSFVNGAQAYKIRDNGKCYKTNNNCEFFNIYLRKRNYKSLVPAGFYWLNSTTITYKAKINQFELS